MNVKILDCTLRDGGYINNFDFGKTEINAIISKLSSAAIDIVECGFLSDVKYDEDHSLYDSIDVLKTVLNPKNINVLYVAMIALGEKEISYEKIPFRDDCSIDGIRITFHEKEIAKALEYGRDLKRKGYAVFMQPVGTTSYTDENLLKLIKDINILAPYAFYIVDTLGTMYENDLLRLFYLVDNNLNESCHIGFHSHNNLQLSFSNAQALLKLHTKRTVIIDSSVFGMGRGAGNLCTELLTQYINDNIELRYNTIPLLEIVDEYLGPIYAKYTWGYSVPYFLAAINKCHPNYASHLLNKQTISVKLINELLCKIPLQKRTLFDKTLIEDIYVSYQKHSIDDRSVLSAIKSIVDNRDILVLGPGKSIETFKTGIDRYIKENDSFVISVNFIPKEYKCGFAFVSNSKRFNNIIQVGNNASDPDAIIITSNIQEDLKAGIYRVNYESLLNASEDVGDNAGLMLIELLIKMQIKSVSLAGFDGFSENRNENFYQEKLINSIEIIELMKKNDAMKDMLHKLSQSITIKFVTPSEYDN